MSARDSSWRRQSEELLRQDPAAHSIEPKEYFNNFKLGGIPLKMGGNYSLSLKTRPSTNGEHRAQNKGR